MTRLSLISAIAVVALLGTATTGGQSLSAAQEDLVEVAETSSGLPGVDAADISEQGEHQGENGQMDEPQSGQHEDGNQEDGEHEVGEHEEGEHGTANEAMEADEDAQNGQEGEHDGDHQDGANGNSGE